MGVQLNIKDPETVRLARELAGRTGLSITESIRGALERDLRQREELLQDRFAEIAAAVDAFQDSIPEEWRGTEMSRLMDDVLYDDHGLPR